MSIPVQPRITVADLRKALSVYPDHMEVDFSQLDFYRLKQRGPNIVQVEFNQNICRDADGYVTVDNFEPA